LCGNKMRSSHTLHLLVSFMSTRIDQTIHSLQQILNKIERERKKDTAIAAILEVNVGNQVRGALARLKEYKKDKQRLTTLQRKLNRIKKVLEE